MNFYAHLSYVCLQLHICTNICFSFTFVLVLSYFYGLPCMQRPAFMQTSFYWNTNTKTGFHTNYTWTCISGSACSHCVTNQKKRETWENTYIATGNFIYACLICVNQTFLFHHTKPDYDCALCAAQNLKPLRGAPGVSEWVLGSRKESEGKKLTLKIMKSSLPPLEDHQTPLDSRVLGGLEVSHYIGPPFLSPPGYRKIDCGSQK